MTYAYKMLFVGAPGAGKTTAISAICDQAPLHTDVPSSEEARTTTVAMDFGQTTLSDGSRLGIYGLPGQQRFDFLWPTLATGTLGVILLLDARTAPGCDYVDWLLSRYQQHLPDTELVIGVTHFDAPGARPLAEFRGFIGQRGIDAPVLPLDAREGAQVQLILRVLVARIESLALIHE